MTREPGAQTLCPVSVSVRVQPLSVLSASGCCNARPSEAYVTTKAAKFFLNNFFISRCHTRCVARARHPILPLLSGDAREANPNRPRFLSASPPAHLLLLLLLVLLGEEGVDPPDLGEHAAVRQAEAEAEEPQAELQESREEREGGRRGLGSRRGFSV